MALCSLASCVSVLFYFIFHGLANRAAKLPNSVAKPLNEPK